MVVVAAAASAPLVVANLRFMFSRFLKGVVVAHIHIQTREDARRESMWLHFQFPSSCRLGVVHLYILVYMCSKRMRTH